MKQKILTSEFLDQYISVVKESPLEKLDNMKKVEIPVDFFQFYK